MKMKNKTMLFMLALTGSAHAATSSPVITGEMNNADPLMATSIPSSNLNIAEFAWSPSPSSSTDIKFDIDALNQYNAATQSGMIGATDVTVGSIGQTAQAANASLGHRSDENNVLRNSNTLSNIKMVNNNTINSTEDTDLSGKGINVNKGHIVTDHSAKNINLGFGDAGDAGAGDADAG
jgi:hypothetical protein